MKKALTLITIFLLLASTNSFAQIARSITLLANADPYQLLTEATSNNYKKLQVPQISQGHVVFEGETLSGNSGIYANLHGGLTMIANKQTPAPFGKGNFTSFSNLSDFSSNLNTYVASINNNAIAFLGTDTNWDTAIYRDTPTENLQMVANLNTPIAQGKGDFTGFAFPSMTTNSGVIFWGKGNDDQEGLYRANKQGLLSKLIDTNTNIPNGQGNFQHVKDPSVSTSAKQNNNFAFIGTGSDRQIGIYHYQAGKSTMIANKATDIPGEDVGFFTNFSGLSFDAKNNEFAFIGFGILGQEGVFYYKDGKIIPAVSQTSILPNSPGQFKTFSHTNIQNGYLVFQATGSYNTQGIYLYKTNGDLYKIMDNKDKINNKHVNMVSISDHALSNKQVTALVKFSNGTSGIYIITLN